LQGEPPTKLERLAAQKNVIIAKFFLPERRESLAEGAFTVQPVLFRRLGEDVPALGGMRLQWSSSTSDDAVETLMDTEQARTFRNRLEFLHQLAEQSAPQAEPLALGQNLPAEVTYQTATDLKIGFSREEVGGQVHQQAFVKRDGQSVTFRP